MAINTTYKPSKVSDFEASKLNANYQSIQGTCTAGTIKNLDMVLTDDHLISGMEVTARGSNFGDTISFQVLMGATVVNQFVTNWGVCTDTQVKIAKEIAYPAKLYAGLTLRVVYTSTGTVDVNIIINLDLHKVLI